MKGVRKVARAAARLAEPDLPDHLVEGFADTVAEWLRGLIAVEHKQVAGWGGVPGECGVECACGVVFDNFDTIGEASALLDQHIAAETTAPRWVCKAWCMSVDNPESCKGTCMHDGTWLAATRGAAALTDYAVKLPRVEANACITDEGERAVHVSIHGPISQDDDRAAWAYLSPAEARRFARAMLAEADLVEGAAS